MSAVGFFPGMPTGGGGGGAPAGGGGTPAWASVLTTLLDVGKGAYQTVDEQNKANVESDKKQAEADKVIAADRALVAAIARARLVKSAQGDADVTKAKAAQATAAQNLSFEASEQRRKALVDSIATFETALQKAKDASAASPKDAKKQVAADLAQYFVEAARGVLASLDGKTAEVAAKSKPGFFTRPVIGPVPGWAVLSIGAGLLGAVGYIGYRIYKRG